MSIIFKERKKNIPLKFLNLREECKLRIYLYYNVKPKFFLLLVDLIILRYISF
jgi:hypothetical protein